jgi:hypothetical protein
MTQQETPPVVAESEPDGAALQPASLLTVAREVRQEAQDVDGAWRYHLGRAKKWDRVAALTRLLIALVSGVSAITAVADDTRVAVGFAILTALIAAINAGYSPAELAKRHREAAVGYGTFRRALNEYSWKLADQLDEPRMAYASAEDAEATRKQRATELRAAWLAFRGLRQEISQIDAAAPSVYVDRSQDALDALGQAINAAENREPARTASAD